jgi:hypothetical protein
MRGVAPLEPGNLWKYYDIGWLGGEITFYVTDSVKTIGNITYNIVETYEDKYPIRFKNYLGFFSNYYLRFDTYAEDNVHKYYKKNSQIGDSWIQKLPGFFTFYYSVIDTFTINAWGKTLFSRVIKITDYSLLVEVYQVWADSIGLMEENSIGQYHMVLRGCVINGVVYGDTTTVNVKGDFELLRTYTLFQNHPNPFNPITRITFYLPFGSDVSLKVYNLFGEEARMLVNEYRSAGSYTEIFNGQGFPSGVYVYILKVDSYIQAKKMILLK